MLVALVTVLAIPAAAADAADAADAAGAPTYTATATHSVRVPPHAAQGPGGLRPRVQVVPYLRELQSENNYIL